MDCQSGRRKDKYFGNKKNPKIFGGVKSKRPRLGVNSIVHKSIQQYKPHSNIFKYFEHVYTLMTEKTGRVY